MDGIRATLTSQVGVLPSYTALGMASLLPHRTLTYQPGSPDVLVDGKPTSSFENRNEIMKGIGGIACKASDPVRPMATSARSWLDRAVRSARPCNADYHRPLPDPTIPCYFGGHADHQPPPLPRRRRQPAGPAGARARSRLPPGRDRRLGLPLPFGKPHADQCPLPPAVEATPMPGRNPGTPRSDDRGDRVDLPALRRQRHDHRLGRLPLGQVGLVVIRSAGLPTGIRKDEPNERQPARPRPDPPAVRRDYPARTGPDRTGARPNPSDRSPTASPLLGLSGRTRFLRQRNPTDLPGPIGVSLERLTDFRTAGRH